MVLICQNKGAKIILHAKSPTFRAAKLLVKGFTVTTADAEETLVAKPVIHVKYVT